jgi:hypothetical protein
MTEREWGAHSAIGSPRYPPSPRHFSQQKRPITLAEFDPGDFRIFPGRWIWVPYRGSGLVCNEDLGEARPAAPRRPSGPPGVCTGPSSAIDNAGKDAEMRENICRKQFE